ncbi:hypothetical protein CR513_12692, partial [Mucuna pruriens]
MTITGPAATRDPTTLPPTIWPCPPARYTVSPVDPGGAGPGRKVPCDHSTRSRRLSKSNIGDGATATEHANPTLTPPCKLGYTFCNISSSGYLHDVAPEGIWAVPCHKYWWFWLVFGSRRSSSWSASSNLNCTLVRFIFILFIFFYVVATTGFVDCKLRRSDLSGHKEEQMRNLSQNQAQREQIRGHKTEKSGEREKDN